MSIHPSGLIKYSTTHTRMTPSAGVETGAMSATFCEIVKGVQLHLRLMEFINYER